MSMPLTVTRFLPGTLPRSLRELNEATPFLSDIKPVPSP